MLINKENNDYIRHVQFVSYTGRYPYLCMGVLILKIDGEECTFTSFSSDEDKNRYDSFWHTGGQITKDYDVIHGEWEIDVNQIPEKYRQYASEIDEVFNDNVDYGCCGGCI